MTRPLHHAAFAVGLLAILWVGAGYFPGHPLALTLVLLIGAFFLMGALELHRFHQATTGLVQALDTLQEAPPSLSRWIASVPPLLQHAVRQRVEGERVALPGLPLTPYLSGLLVLLGMLGTFLGMVVTLKGTGLALEHATDVEVIRASLVAPIKGLGLAFGASVAGVAASAMLGLMSALTRRERLRAVQQLDTHLATTLRPHSRAHQREESLRLMRAQAETMPALVAQLQALVAQTERQGQALQERLESGQAQFHGEAQRAYTGLADSVDRSLKASLGESARLAGAAIEPAVQAALAGMGRETATLREALAAAAHLQLEGVTARLDSTTTALSERWQAALSEQLSHGAGVMQGVSAAFDRHAQDFEQRAAALLDGVAARMDRGTDAWSSSLAQAQARQEQAHAALAQHTRETLASSAAGLAQQTEAMLQRVAEAHAQWDAAFAERERERMGALHEGLTAMAASLHREGQQAGSAIAERQQQICLTLEQTAQAITAQTEARTRATLDEIARVAQAAAQAPRAAAEVIGELRAALSDSLVRDNAALDERNRLLGTLGGLLDAVNHASTEQRNAIDALVHTTTDMLERAGARFTAAVEAESHTLQAVSAQLGGSAAEVASLGEGFGVAVQRFSGASEQLTAQLQRIEAALGQSMVRSDEQLAYYVAQAREIVDLTLGSQKQVIDDLQKLAAQRPATAQADAA